MDGKTEARKGGADWEKEAYCPFLGSGQIMEKGPKGTRIDKVLYWVSDALDGFK
jgi:hypothetical protein